MPVERARVLPLFKDIHLFAGMDDAQLSKVARYFSEKTYLPDEVIIREGSPGDNFYVIEQGQVAISRKINNVEQQTDILTAGDYFGEEALLTRRPRAATVRAMDQATLLTSDKTQFHRLLVEFPHLKRNLLQIASSRRFVRQHPFTWLNDDEVVYQVQRKHIAVLFLMLVAPAFVLLLGLTLLAISLFALGLATPVGIGLLVLASVISLFGLGWVVWSIIDWSNDYYIVTNQRVVWIEQVVWLYRSQVEAPLDAVRGVNLKTSFGGRLLGYGDVIVSTYTGEVVLRTVNDPAQMDAVIREFLRRVQRLSVKARQAETEREVLKIIGREPSETTAPASPQKKTPQRLQKEVAPGEVRELTFSERYLGNLFRLRLEDGETITYRKHWLKLLLKTWKPGLLFLLLLAALIVSLIFLAQGRFPGSLMGIIIVLIIVLWIPTFAWWAYNYADWANDIYQITKDSLYDIERRPFGTETRTSTSLDKIISLTHQRSGFIGYLFNMGNVIVNVGDTKLTFNGVYQPARVQQDVFQHMQKLQAKKQSEEVARERDRILTLLQVYHQQVNKTEE